MRKLGKGAMKAAGSWAMQPRLDVYDLEDKLIVQADAPGIPRDRIEVRRGGPDGDRQRQDRGESRGDQLCLGTR